MLPRGHVQVGHTAAVLVARYSPRMFRVNGTLKACLALGSQVCFLQELLHPVTLNAFCSLCLQLSARRYLSKRQKPLEVTD